MLTSQRCAAYSHLRCRSRVYSPRRNAGLFFCCTLYLLHVRSLCRLPLLHFLRRNPPTYLQHPAAVVVVVVVFFFFAYFSLSQALTHSPSPHGLIFCNTNDYPSPSYTHTQRSSTYTSGTKIFFTSSASSHHLSRPILGGFLGRRRKEKRELDIAPRPLPRYSWYGLCNTLPTFFIYLRTPAAL